jgi:membrane protein implicated in regulation of membrane protease activity
MNWFVIFALTAFVLWLLREYRVERAELESPTAPHRAGERYIGQVVTLPDGIRDGAGRVKLGVRQWRLRGPNVPAGARVRVTGVDGSTLIVDRLPS